MTTAKSFTVVAACCAASALTPLTAHSQQAATGSVEGRVVNATTKEPLVGATVQLVGTQLGAISRAEGKFTIKKIPNGVYTLKVTSLGYRPELVSDVVIGTGKPYTLTVELLEQAVQIEAAEVEADYFRRTNEAITSTQLLNAEDIRRAPGVQEDVVRAVALLPGVGVTQAGRNDLVVRGGAPFENLFLVDNIEVPNINHFGSQGSTGGPLSLINIDFVRETQFSTGGFSTQFGDKVSSVTNIKLREGNDERFAGEVNLSATGFGVIAEGPIPGNGSFLASVRRSYLDLIFKAAGFGFIPEYWDFQLKTVNRIDSKNSIEFLTIGALNSVTLNNDDADKRFDNSQVATPQLGQYFSGITWKTLFENGYANITLGRTWTRFETSQNDSNLVTIFRNNSTEGETSLRADFIVQFSDKFDLSFGNIAKYASALDYNIILPGFLRVDQAGNQRPLTVDTSFTTFRNGTYFYANYSATENLRITGGARVDFYPFLDDQTLYFSPRAALRWSFDDTRGVTLSAGRYVQSPSWIWLVGDTQNSQTLRAITANQAVLSYDHVLASDLKFQVEGYYKVYDNYPARVFRPQAVLAPAGFDDVTSDIPFGLEPLAGVGTGTSYGAEIFLQKKLSDVPLYGLLSLSVNKTTVTGIDGIERAGSFDTRFIGNLAVGWRIDSEWEISGKVRAATGLPTTPFNSDGTLDFTRWNAGERLPFFHSADLRIDKRWPFAGFQLITYIDIQNIYARKNVSGIRWNAREGRAELNESIGILPSIGINIEF